MYPKLKKVFTFLLCFLLCFEQSGFAQVAGQLDISGHLAAFRNTLIPDTFRPLHLRYLQYNSLNNSFQLFLDKGSLKNPQTQELENTTKTLLNYFFIGVTLPNDAFWVNLRPDAEDQIIDDKLAQTDVGKIMLETDLQLKKDTAKFTSPETPEGREYWDKLYKKAGEIFGSENITIPTLTRPWIVPDEIIIRETTDSAYIYKATLKVMLEQDYLKDSAVYNFKDDRLKELNEYSSQLIREIIIPKLTKEVNSSKRYSSLRQVYYSLIMAQWFKVRFANKDGLYSRIIDRKVIYPALYSKESWSKTTYFKAYQKSFKDGEYNIQEPVYTLYGQTIRSYFSGGTDLNIKVMPRQFGGISDNRADLNGIKLLLSPAPVELPDALTTKDELKEIKMQGTDNPGEISNIQMTENHRSVTAASPIVKELTIYGDVSYDDWKQAILKENRWNEGANFRRLLGTNRVLVLGDTNHGLLGIQRALVEHLTELKEADVTHLALEIDSDLKVSDVDKIAQSVWIPHRFKQLVELAEQIGLKVIFIDMPESQRQASWSEKQTGFERGVYMGKYVSRFLRDNPTAVMTVVTGYAHIQDYNQIPAQLDNNGFQYSLVPLVSEGQQDSNPFGLEVYFIMLPVVQAIREVAEPNKNYGYIDLVGLPFETRGAIAILHFPRPRVTAPTARSLESGETLENGTTALDVRRNLTQLAPVAENAIAKPVYSDFQDRVYGNVRVWDTTNQYKIIELVRNLEGISSGQKFYLATLLINYANNTGRHSLSGSIIDIGFVPEGQFFEITTVDTFNYPYDPNTDYGSLKRHWEVSLRTLQEQFGFEDILIKDLSEVPEISIRNNPNRPLSIMKILLLVLTANKYPERVAVGYEMLAPSSLSVFKGEPGKSVRIARLEFEDFMLTNLEQALMEAAEVARKINNPLSSLHAIFRDTLMPTRVNFLKRRRVEAIRDSLWEATKVASIGIQSDTKGEIFKARKKLSVLSDEQSAQLLAKLDEAISRTEEALRLVEEYASENRSFAQARYMTDHPSAGTNLAQAQYLLLKLRAARSRISVYPALTSSVRPALTESAVTTPVSQANLIESAIPSHREGFERYKYFTGRTDREALRSLLTEGIYLRDFGRDQRIWNTYEGDFDEYMFHERDGELGYVVFVDIPAGIVSQATAMDGDFWDNVRNLISEEGNPSDSNYTADTPKLRTEFIIGAIDQRTGEWFSPTQGKEELPTIGLSSSPIEDEKKEASGKETSFALEVRRKLEPIFSQVLQITSEDEALVHHGFTSALEKFIAEKGYVIAAKEGILKGIARVGDTVTVHIQIVGEEVQGYKGIRIPTLILRGTANTQDQRVIQDITIKIQPRPAPDEIRQAIQDSYPQADPQAIEEAVIFSKEEVHPSSIDNIVSWYQTVFRIYPKYGKARLTIRKYDPQARETIINHVLDAMDAMESRSYPWTDEEIIQLYKSFKSEQKSSPASSPMIQESEKAGNMPGGIDFRHLPIVTQAVTNLSGILRDSPLRGQSLLEINLDEEWRQIERMANSGITPSSERIKEYIQTSCAQDNITQDRDKILLCISDILRQEEERCDHTNATLIDILVVLESMSNAQELRQVFLGTIS